uniref:Craniofacial development protein 2-like n=1 Tax=Nicotiana tabacum TaxID=4097 RepID=A0A1S3ZKL0_TOBAC|nr:PREDICTED: craniofacial development protein 2-like [Nicotiana tabacum]
MAIKIVVGGLILNIISAYAPQMGLDEEVKRNFWEDLDGLVWGTSHTEKLIIGGDFNGHIGTSSGVTMGCIVSLVLETNVGGDSLLECSKSFDLVIANSCFPKKEEHMVTFQSTLAKTQIDYILLRRCDRGLRMDYEAILSENLTTQHRLLVMNLEIMQTRKKRVVYGLPRIWCGAMTKDKAQELGEKLLAMGGLEE